MNSIVRSGAGKRRVCSLLFAVLLLMVFQAFADSDIRYVYTENGGSLNMRDQPSKKARILERMPSGTQVKVLQEEKVWSKIIFGEKTGYVMTDYLKIDRSDNTKGQWQSVSGSMYVDTDNGKSLHLREEPSRSSRSLAQIVNGTRVNVTAISSSWAHVQVSGQEGYMMKSFLSSNAPEESKSADEMFIKGSRKISLYQEPDTASVVVLSVLGGTKVRVCRQLGKWSQIVVYGTMGYVSAASLSREGIERKDKKTAMIVNPNGASYVNMRNSPGLKSEKNVLAHIKVNTPVLVIGRSGTWCKIMYEDLVGYVNHKFLQYD